MTEIPQPEDIYRNTKEEGERRLERPLLEMISTALAAGFDIVAGVAALGLVITKLEPWVGKDPAHVFGSLAFGIGFVFLVVGRGELFTENFLVPIAGLDHRRGSSWLGLAKLWITSQPSAASASSCGMRSTPSATTPSPSVCASLMIEATIV